MNELRLDLEGTIFHLIIEGYTREQDRNKDGYDDYWCKVSMAATSDSINYSTVDNEILMSCEIDYLIHLFKTLLVGEPVCNKEIEFVEPDIGLVIYSNEDKPGLLIDMHLNLWNKGALTANFISLCLGEEDIKAFAEYLEWVVR